MSHLLDLWPGPWTCDRCVRNPTWSGPAPPESYDKLVLTTRAALQQVGSGDMLDVDSGTSPKASPSYETHYSEDRGMTVLSLDTQI